MHIAVGDGLFGVLLGLGVLVLIYVLLGLEVMHRAAVAVFGASVVLGINLILKYTTFTELIEGINLDTILLLMSMMMLVAVLSRTGAFDYMAYRILTSLYRNPFKLVAVLTAFTAAVSAFIDNVTTVLLVTPIALRVCRRLKVDPRPLLLSIVFASNIGGTATLIGDPPNIIIGSMAHLGFMEFIYNLTPIVAVDFLAFLGLTKFMYRSWLREFKMRVSKLELEVGEVKTEKALLYKTVATLAVVVVLFFFQDALGYPPAVPALIGVGVMFLLARRSINAEEVIAEVDWPTLVFFMGLFIVIKGVEELGLMDFIAECILHATTDYAAIMMVILWVSAVVSAFVDNIPFTMSMVPVVKIIASHLSADPRPLYWALSLGACLGGNGTLIGASANVVVVSIAEKHGYHVSFAEFLKRGMAVVLLTVGVSAAYLLLRYCLLKV